MQYSMAKRHHISALSCPKERTVKLFKTNSTSRPSLRWLVFGFSTYPSSYPSPKGRRNTVYPLPSGEGGQRPGEGPRSLNPRRLEIILDLELVKKQKKVRMCRSSMRTFRIQSPVTLVPLPQAPGI